MCWYCGDPVTEKAPIGRSQRCLTCGKDLRACKNCRFFVLGARGDCRETNAEPQADKERANFCDWFSLDEKFLNSQSQSEEKQKSESSRAAFDNLFK